jgi:hypothetical protein
MKIIYTFLMVFLTSPIYLTTQQWKPIGSTGGRLDSLGIHPYIPKIILNGAVGGNSLQNTFGGMISESGNDWEWTNLTTSQVHSILIDEDNPEIIYACASGGLLKTVNGGSEWKVVCAKNAEFFKMLFDPNGKDVAYLTSDYGLFKSADGGNEWELTSLRTIDADYPYEIAVHPQNSDTIYAGMIGWDGNRDLYRSTDGGNTWTNLRLTKGEDDVFKIIFDPFNRDIIYAATSSKGIFKSIDKGMTWFQVNSGLKREDPPDDPSIKPIRSLEIVPSNSLKLYADNGGVVKTTNGGAAWFRIDSALFELDGNIGVVNINYLNDVLYVSAVKKDGNLVLNKGNLYMSRDDGLSWQKIGEFDIDTFFTGDVKSNPRDPDELYISTRTGIYKGKIHQNSVIKTDDIPQSTILYQNYPNPFNSTTQIQFDIVDKKGITLSIYNIAGEEIKTITMENHPECIFIDFNRDVIHKQKKWLCSVKNTVLGKCALLKKRENSVGILPHKQQNNILTREEFKRWYKITVSFVRFDYI